MPVDKEMIGYIKKAAKLNETGARVSRPARDKTPKDVEVPDYFLAALKRNRKAFSTFEKFSPNHKREYVEWITEAKTEATRDKRLATAVDWIAEGKSRNWKYMR